MTVQELIDKLKKVDPNLRVRSALFGNGPSAEIVTVRETVFVRTRDGEVYEDHPDEPGARPGVLLTDV